MGPQVRGKLEPEDVLQETFLRAFQSIEHERLGGSAEAAPQETSGGTTGDGEPDALRRADEWARIFSPRGTFVAAQLDSEHWLGFGVPPRLPVHGERSATPSPESGGR